MEDGEPKALAALIAESIESSGYAVGGHNLTRPTDTRDAGLCRPKTPSAPGY